MRSAEFGTQINQDGFTLIEAIMTLIILSIAAVGVLSVFTVGMKGSANPLITEQAIQLAQGEMEQAIGEKIANDFPSMTAVVGGPCKTLPSAAFPTFSCKRTIVDINANTKQTTVTVSNAVIGSVVLDTLITNY